MADVTTVVGDVDGDRAADVPDRQDDAAGSMTYGVVDEDREHLADRGRGGADRRDVRVDRDL